MSKKIDSIRANLSALASEHINAGEEHRALHEQSGDKAEKRKAQWHTTHGTYNGRVAGMTDGALAVAVKYGMTAEKVNAASREYKKRLIALCEAIASGTRPRDNAADAMLAYIFETGADSVSLEVLQREARHETQAQAGYFRTALALLGGAEKTKGAMIVKHDAPIMRALGALYGAIYTD